MNMFGRCRAFEETETEAVVSTGVASDSIQQSPGTPLTETGALHVTTASELARARPIVDRWTNSYCESDQVSYHSIINNH
jgi:hypothetical protein